MGYYRNLDTIGLISLNDWYVLEFRLKNSGDDRHNRGEENYTTSTFGNTGEIRYSSDSNFDGAMASIEVTPARGLWGGNQRITETSLPGMSR